MNEVMGKARQLVEKGYPLRVYRDPDSGDWVAEAPDLPGCIGVGDDPERAVRVCQKFVQGWLEEALQQGWPIPEPSVPVAASGRLLLRMPKFLHARLQARAEIEGTSLNQLIVTLLAQALAAREAETAHGAIRVKAHSGLSQGREPVVTLSWVLRPEKVSVGRTVVPGERVASLVPSMPAGEELAPNVGKEAFEWRH